jgi:hypothetical protein
MRRAASLTLIFLLLASLYGLPLNKVEASQPVYRKIAGYDPPLMDISSLDWPDFWGKFNQYADWNLEWHNGSNWISVKQDLQIVRDYPEPNRVKLTLVFDASHEGDYRLTFAVNKLVKDYITKAENHVYQLNYGNYSLTFDWSDAAAINGIVFKYGVQDDYFWFRMRRDNVPLGAHVEIDPELIVEYDLSNVDGYLAMQDLHPSDEEYHRSAMSMSFETPGTDSVLSAVDLKIAKWGTGGGNPTGNATVQIFAHSGPIRVNHHGPDNTFPIHRGKPDHPDKQHLLLCGLREPLNWKRERLQLSHNWDRRK